MLCASRWCLCTQARWSPLVASTPGAKHVHVAELASGLVRLGHSVAVYTRRDDPDLTEWVTTSAGYEVITGAGRTGGPDLREWFVAVHGGFR